ncbi:hypothetical protein [Paraburkholderia tagetis]|uniref:Uncharacterized protein n=1 Tax=Paraburkholderia tagetis TaxID=2913261 RepID=A0A9X1UMD5_9BURK|nr:hypothetical protein [Paraburkholderia tagetis]MCG5078102.1 hypothetical protein [Paraburkholderia tagetis]
MTASFTWWEKTVEYAFILQTEKKVDFAAPLAGVEERAGDGIFASDSRLVLIEFKRSYDTLSSERGKFANFANAAATLSARDAHHFIVYGYEVQKRDDDKPWLGLAAETYFSAKEPKTLNAMFDAGLSKDSFNAYLDEFLRLKRPDGRSSGTISPTAYASVFGVSKSQGVKTVAMEDYLIHELKYEYTMEPPQNAHEIRLPGMGGRF